MNQRTQSRLGGKRHSLEVETSAHYHAVSHHQIIHTKVIGPPPSHGGHVDSGKLRRDAGKAPWLADLRRQRGRR